MIIHIQCNLLDYDIFAHQVNCRGKWGKGIALDIKKKYPKIFSKFYVEYKLFTRLNPFTDILGMTMVVKWNDIIVFNLFGQRMTGLDKRHTDYDAVKSSLHHMHKYMITHNMKEVYLPYKMGCVNGGGDWSVVLPIIENEFQNSDIKVYIVRKE